MFNPYMMRVICRDVLRLRNSDGSKHPIPTVGFQMLYWLRAFAPANCKIFVTGFTWHVDEYAGTANGQDIMGDEFPGHYNHSYLREVKWCAANLVEHPAFTFGPKTRRALYYVR